MADKYAVTVEENRRLYNEVQDLKGNIRVFCRIRPLGTTGDRSEGSCLTVRLQVLAVQQAALTARPWWGFDCCSIWIAWLGCVLFVGLTGLLAHWADH